MREKHYLKLSPKENLNIPRKLNLYINSRTRKNEIITIGIKTTADIKDNLLKLMGQ